MKEKRALGRGLSALISSPVSVTSGVSAGTRSIDGNAAVAFDERTSEKDHKIKDVSHVVSTQSGSPILVSMEAIRPNPNQPRREFKQEELDDLANSIRTLGVLQPILVRSAADGGYEIVAGERRWRAAKIAGLASVPVLVKDLSELEVLEVSIVENVQRQDLNPIEEALGYERLSNEFGLSQEQIAEATGKSRAVVANAMRLLKLPQEVLKLLELQQISVGHAKCILSVKEPAAQIGLARKAIEEGLSVRALEAIVGRTVVLEQKVNKTTVRSSPQSPVAALPDIEERLRRSLGTKVQIRSSKGGKGVIQIQYYSLDELNRIIEVIAAEEH